MYRSPYRCFRLGDQLPQIGVRHGTYQLFTCPTRALSLQLAEQPFVQARLHVDALLCQRTYGLGQRAGFFDGCTWNFADFDHGAGTFKVVVCMESHAASGPNDGSQPGLHIIGKRQFGHIEASSL